LAAWTLSTGDLGNLPDSLTKKGLESLFQRLAIAAGKRRWLAKRLPRGINPFADIRRMVKDYRFELIFDVGANIGQSAKLFRRMDEGARILSFEPVAPTFAQLQRRTASLANHEAFNLAFGDEERHARILLREKSTLNSVLNEVAASASPESGEVEIAITTLDLFCQRQGIRTINFLKTDTEGYELQVLRGGEGLLAHSRIDFLQIELGFDPTNVMHVGFSTMHDYMEAHRYSVLGIYNQASDWGSRPILRFADVVFASHKVVERAMAH
jgi:FkbM family methyltransferase